MVGQAEGSGFGAGVVMSRPSFAQTSITFAPLETGSRSRSTAHYRKVGKIEGGLQVIGKGDSMATTAVHR